MHLSPEDEALLARIPPDARARHGVPDPEVAAARERAAAVVASSVDGTLRVSPLGAGWSSDLDVHVRVLPPTDALRHLGWRSLDALLRRVGSDASGRWALCEGGRWVAGVDLTTAPAPDPVVAVGARARRRGEVRLREVLELRALRRDGLALEGAGAEVLAAAATLERRLGGAELATFDVGGSGASTMPLPIGLPVAVRARHAAATARRAVLGPRVVVGLSGVDGSGKSSLAKDVVHQLVAAGVPATVVWARPGMRLGGLQALARLGRRLVGQGPEPGVRAVASGETGTLPSRRGFVGWAWAFLVAVAFAIDIRKRHAQARGVVLYDRHLLDALVTLDFVYAGVDLRVARWICRRALPRADLCFYVDVPADVAVTRKPGDTFGRHAVTRQLDGYARWLGEVPAVTVLDGTQRPDALAATVLDRLLHPDRR